MMNCKSLSSSSTSSLTSSSSLSEDEKDISDDIDLTEITVDHHDKAWIIHGKSYDMDAFVDQHPGGREAILLGRGRDCTALFESYHVFSKHHPRNILEKFLIPGKPKVTGPPKEDFFYDLLKERVTAVLKQNGIDPSVDRGATPSRVAFYVTSFIGWLVSGYLHLTGSILGSFSFGIFGWLMAALGHDAGHFAVSHSMPWINEWGVWAMGNIFNPVIWQIHHTYAHHSFTNDVDHDPDIHNFRCFLRVHENVKHKKAFKYQALKVYLAVVYSLTVFGGCVLKPRRLIRLGDLEGIVKWKDIEEQPSKAWGMTLHQEAYVLLIILVPFYTHSSFWKAGLAVVIHLITIGWLFAAFSQVNHFNQPSMNALSTKNSKRDPRLLESWAAEQVETSNNFATDNYVWHFLSIGLNHQIEHHLFPGLNHCHLHHVAPIVKQTCEEFGVNYKSYDSWSQLLGEMLDWLISLSVEQDTTECKERLGKSC